MFKAVFFTLSSAIVGLAGLLIATILTMNVAGDGDSWLLPIVFYITVPTLMISGVWNLFYNRAHVSSGVRGVVSVEALPETLILKDSNEMQKLFVTVFRQSGGVERSYISESRQHAISDIQTIFRRKGHNQLRIWINTERKCKVTATSYHARGTKEGRIISGVTVEVR